ncbi:MAG: TRAP transporter large permease subunit, partial [Methylobacterium sp.]|nr:TRAP transporter large permease subunit [Methylobacterium sp.]
MEITILFGTFAIMLLMGIPVAFCLGLSSLATVLYMGIPPVVVFQQLSTGMNAFAMLAIPFFIYSGDLMIRGGIADRLIQFATSLVGHLRGGLGQVNVL